MRSIGRWERVRKCVNATIYFAPLKALNVILLTYCLMHVVRRRSCYTVDTRWIGHPQHYYVFATNKMLGIHQREIHGKPRRRATSTKKQTVCLFLCSEKSMYSWKKLFGEFKVANDHLFSELIFTLHTFLLILIFYIFFSVCQSSSFFFFCFFYIAIINAFASDSCSLCCCFRFLFSLHPLSFVQIDTASRRRPCLGINKDILAYIVYK